MEATPTQVINYFSGFKQNLVPLFQRPYTWSEKQWRTLWDDILSFYDYSPEDVRSTHFMGAVVTMPARSVPVGVSKFLVIDGQQRLTTIAVILSAIRDVLDANHLAYRRRIQHFYLTNEGFDGPDVFKLLPTQGDRKAYAAMIEGAGDPLPDSQFRKAYEFFRRRLRDQAGDSGSIDPTRVLEIIEKRLMVVMINLSDTDDPYLIFESLNFKGSPLEQADLVRNYFLMRFPMSDQQPVYDKLWLPMQNRLGPTLTEFMRHFLGAEGEEVRKGDVYAAIKRLVSDSDAPAVRLLMTRMERLSAFYSRLSSADPDPNADFRQFFDYFRRLDFGSVYPLLLALYEDYADGQFGADEFVNSLKILHSFIIRRMVVGVPSNSLSGLFISLCKSKPVTEAPSAWLAGVLAAESKNRRWPSDQEFAERWIHTPIYGSRACPVILESIEKHHEHHEAVAFDQCSIEHVMPQTLTPAWEETLGPSAADTHREWLHTIGNLTLTGYNPELSNRYYTEKQATFALSHFELNRYFSGILQWGPAEMQARADVLFKSALSLWPRPALVVETAENVEKTAPASFHGDCIRLVQNGLSCSLSKLSQTRYESGDGRVRLICAVSAEHNESGGVPYYWFAVHQSQLEFLEAASNPWVCFGCDSAELTFLLPLSAIRDSFSQMSATKTEDRHYWHVVIQKKPDRYVLRLLGGKDGADLGQFRLGTGSEAATV